MRRANCILVILALFAAAQIAGVNVKAYRGQEASAQPLAQEGPQVSAARLKGNKLIVTGVNFNEGAVIFVDGAAVGTRSDPDNPSGSLIAKKAGKRIAPETIVSISVQNSTGVMSQPFDLFAGLVITFDDNGNAFGLAVGDKFQVVLQKDPYEWSEAAFDSALITKLTKEPPLPGSQGVFQATQAGTTQLSSFGELPCAKVTPPCLAPTLGFRVTLIIKQAN
jgi:hypothetical protein